MSKVAFALTAAAVEAAQSFDPFRIHSQLELIMVVAALLLLLLLLLLPLPPQSPTKCERGLPRSCC